MAATAGLLVSAGPLERWLAGSRPGRLRALMAAATAVPLAASFWTLPLQLLHFGVVPLYAVPANLLAEPLITPLTLGAMAMAPLAVLLPASLPLLSWLLAIPTRLLLLIAHGIASLPMAQWQTGRPQPLLVLLFSLALLALLVPRLARRCRWPALGLLVVTVVLHTTALRADALLLVHQFGADLLVARHAGRAALVAGHSDSHSCRQAARLARGLGVERFDWLLLLDPVAPADPACWRTLAGFSLIPAEGATPLAVGQRLLSPGLEARALTPDSHALALKVGRQQWLLLPDRAAWLSLQSGSPGATHRGQSLWLGFRPRPSERTHLESLGLERVWLSGEAPRALPARWQATGDSGHLIRSVR